MLIDEGWEDRFECVPEDMKGARGCAGSGSSSAYQGSSLPTAARERSFRLLLALRRRSKSSAARRARAAAPDAAPMTAFVPVDKADLVVASLLLLDDDEPEPEDPEEK